MQDSALRNCYATLIAGFVVGGFLVAAEVPDPVPSVAAVVTWFAIPAAALFAAVKGL